MAKELSAARSFAGIRVSPMRRDEVLAQVGEYAPQAKRLRITFLNPDYARRALRTPALRQAINAFDLVLVDGNGVRLLAPLFGFRVPERLDTDSLPPFVFRLLAEQHARIFLLGCAPGVAERAGERLRDAFPGLLVVGTEHGFHDVQRGHPGYFSQEDTSAIVSRVNSSNVQFLLVSLPTPLQQRSVIANSDRLRVPVIMTGGSYLDHVAAGVGADNSWYPRWVDVLRLNWLYRLAREPRRLWRRYTIDFAEFVLLVVIRRISRAKDSA